MSCSKRIEFDKYLIIWNYIVFMIKNFFIMKFKLIVKKNFLISNIKFNIKNLKNSFCYENNIFFLHRIIER